MLALFLRLFFFQAEDGIRYLTVTGVQTCALPILRARLDDDLVHVHVPRSGEREEDALGDVLRLHRLDASIDRRSLLLVALEADEREVGDRKSTRLNSSHSQISYAVFCLTKQNIHT